VLLLCGEQLLGVCKSLENVKQWQEKYAVTAKGDEYYNF
jgi:hypothetical protein